MARFIKVRGKSGELVSNPHAHGSNPRRYAGKRFMAPKADAPVDAETHHVDRYEDVEEVLMDHPDLRSAVKAGALELIHECVAKAHADAHALMAPKADAPKPKKGDG